MSRPATFAHSHKTTSFGWRYHITHFKRPTLVCWRLTPPYSQQCAFQRGEECVSSAFQHIVAMHYRTRRFTSKQCFLCPVHLAMLNCLGSLNHSLCITKQAPVHLEWNRHLTALQLYLRRSLSIRGMQLLVQCVPHEKQPTFRRLNLNEWFRKQCRINLCRHTPLQVLHRRDRSKSSAYIRTPRKSSHDKLKGKIKVSAL